MQPVDNNQVSQGAHFRKRRRAAVVARPSVPDVTTPTVPGLRLWLAAGACGLAALLVYLRTLCPTVFHGDSGEMIAVAATRGVAHPPGFPLHSLLAALFTWLPFGTVAYRVNLFSAVCDAAAAMLLCRAVARWTGDVWAGVLAAGVFAFSPLVWPYAVSAEVFALNNLFVAGLFDLSVGIEAARADPLRCRRTLLLAAFWVGLGLSNHHIFVFVGPPLLFWLAWRAEGKALGLRTAAWMTAALAAGLLPYLYLPLAARSASPIVWGDTGTLHGFLAHFFRVEYGTFRLAGPETGGAGELLPRLLLAARRFTQTTFWAGPLLVLACVASFARRPATRALGLPWLVAGLGYWIVFSALANVRIDDPLHATVEARFWQQPLVVLAALMGAGLVAATRRLRRGALATRAAIALGLPAAIVAANFGAMDQSRNVFFREYGRAILDSAPPEAILLVTSDEAVGSVRYLQAVEGLRPDVSVVPTGLLTLPWYRAFAERRLTGVSLPARAGFSARELMDANVGRRAVLIVNKVPWLKTLEEAYKPWPMGLADQVLPQAHTPELEVWVSAALSSFERFEPGPHDGFPAGSWERYVGQNYWRQYERFGLALLRVAGGRGSDPAVASLIARALTPLVERHPAPDPSLLKNLGVAYQFLAGTRADARALQRRYWARYLATNPSADPDLPTIRAAVSAATPSP
jgi:hypothetical protein